MGKLRPRGAGSHSGGQRLRLFRRPWPRPRAPRGPALGSHQAARGGGAGRRAPDTARGPRTRPAAHAYLTALLLHFPRRAHKTRLQQMLVDQGKQLPPLPGLSHAHNLRPDGSPARPTSGPARHFPCALRPRAPHFRLLFRRAARHTGKYSLISWSGGPAPTGERGGGSEDNETSYWWGACLDMDTPPRPVLKSMSPSKCFRLAP